MHALWLVALTHIAAAAADDVAAGKIGVASIAGDSDDAIRNAVGDALRGRAGAPFSLEQASVVDSVVQDLASAGVACAGAVDDAHDACWLKVAVNAGLDMLVVGAVSSDGHTLTLRLVDARAPSAPRMAHGDATAPQTVARALVSRDVTPPTPATPPAPLKPTTAPTHTPASTAVTPPAPAPALSPLLITSVIAGGVAGACAITAGVLEATTEYQIDQWEHSDGVIVKSQWEIENGVEIGAIVGAVGAAAVAVGTGFIAFGD